MLNEIPPYRLFNAITQKEIDRVNAVWPMMKIELEKTFSITFDLDKNFSLHYDHKQITATKDDILAVCGNVWKQYYLNKNS